MAGPFCFVRIFYSDKDEEKGNNKNDKNNLDNFYIDQNNDENKEEVLEQKLSVGMKVVENFFKHTLKDCLKKVDVYKEIWPFLEEIKLAPDKPIEIVELKSSLKTEETKKMSDEELWNYHAKEIKQDLAQNLTNTSKFLVIVALPKRRRISLGGGRLALLSAHLFELWPREESELKLALKNTSLVSEEFEDRFVFNKCFAMTVATVVHELGHCFDLGHYNDGIMGMDTANYDQIVLDVLTTVCEENENESKRHNKDDNKSRENNNNKNDISTSKLCSKNDTDLPANQIVWTPSASVILAHHPLLRSPYEESESEILQLDSMVITSSTPLIVLEMRHQTGWLIRAIFQPKQFEILRIDNNHYDLKRAFGEINECDIFLMNLAGARRLYRDVRNTKKP